MSPHSFEFSLARRHGEAHRIPEESKLKLLLLVPAVSEDADLRFIRVDRDNLDAVFADLLPPLSLTVTLAGEDHSVTLGFEDITSFEPEAIARQVELAQTLLGLARSLAAPATAARAAGELMQLLGLSAAAPDKPVEDSSDDSPGGDDFERLLGKSSGSESSPASGRLQSFLDKLMQEHAGELIEDHSQLAEIATVAGHELVRQVLGNPAFKALERTWRGIYWLATSIDLDELVELTLLPVDLGDADPGWLQGESAPATPLFTAIQRQSAGADGGYNVIAYDAAVRTADDIAILRRLAEGSAALGATLLAQAPDALVADSPLAEARETFAVDADVSEAWSTFRTQPGAQVCVAATPRLLLRAPYGRKGESTGLRGFEELLPKPAHEDFVWGAAVYGLLQIICAEFEASGWDMTLQANMLLEDMPLAIYDDGGGEAIKPPGEVYFTEHDVAALQQHGVVAFLSHRNRSSVTLSAFLPVG